MRLTSHSPSLNFFINWTSQNPLDLLEFQPLISPLKTPSPSLPIFLQHTLPPFLFLLSNTQFLILTKINQENQEFAFGLQKRSWVLWWVMWLQALLSFFLVFGTCLTTRDSLFNIPILTPLLLGFRPQNLGTQSLS